MGIANAFKSTARLGLKGLGVGKSFGKGLFTFANPKSYARDVSRLTQGVKRFSSVYSSTAKSAALRQTAKASAVMLGKGSGIVMTARMLQGRNPVKNSKGRVDVPFLPF